MTEYFSQERALSVRLFVCVSVLKAVCEEKNEKNKLNSTMELVIAPREKLGEKPVHHF